MTIAEIAKLAGVSKACVSRYLNHGYVSEEKKRKIQTVIDATGYVPSRQAQILRTGKSRLEPSGSRNRRGVPAAVGPSSRASAVLKINEAGTTSVQLTSSLDRST